MMRWTEEMRDVHGYISGNREIMLINNPGSESVGYGLNVAKMPRRMNVAYSGSCLRIVKNGYFVSSKRALTEI
jgi:hypothetical protein